MGVKILQANVDSRLVANQVNGTYIKKEQGMIKYLEKVRTLTSTFKESSIKQVPRGKNKKAYALSKMAFTSFAHLSKQVLVEELKEKSIDKKGSASGSRRRRTHMYDSNSRVHHERNSSKRKEEGKNHTPQGSMHAGPRSVVAKALRNPQQNLTPITPPWPFYKWGIDIAGPFPEGPGKVKFLIVAIDYFTKWIETKPVAAITGAQIKKFARDNIVCRQQSRKQKAKLKWKKYYNARVRNISFKPGDLVYRNNEASHAEDGGKLGAKWEGPYEFTKALGKGANKLRERNGNILPRTWNVCNLKKCYVHEM
ncbi:reverse transcriptase domain-containing protein [Tanacetum coccineum]